MIFGAENWDKGRWPNFTVQEMQCRETGTCRMDGDTMDMLQELRKRVDAPLRISSGYRAPTHSAERDKLTTGGPHPSGKAVDIKCYGTYAYTVLRFALDVGFTGIGVRQKGKLESRFLHLDTMPRGRNPPRPIVWSY